ncbi:MAG: TonB-dependent receptor [Nitrospinota bacterium]|nr:TonB-dependent receptor [Nitrospinota bacterium]
MLVTRDVALKTIILFGALVMGITARPEVCQAEGLYAVRGKAMVKGERIPLGGATVYVMGRDDIETTTTNATGDFELALPEEGEYMVSASMVGFAEGERLKVIVTSEKPMATGRLYLPPVERFSEIVVTAEKNQDQVGKRVVTGQEMRKTPGSMGDPLRAISNLPGLSTSSGFTGFPAIRGSDPTNNIFYVDNMPTNNLFHYGFVSVFHADLVENFNLYLSSPGPEFKEVLGGVIDITLRDPKTDRLHVKASVSFLEAELLVEGPIAEGHSLVVTGRRSYIDLLVGPLIEELDKGVKVVQFPWYYDYLGKYVWKISPRSKFTLFSHGTQDGMKMEMTDESDVAKKEPDLVGDTAMDFIFNMQGMSLETAFSKSIKNSFTLSRRDFTRNVAVAQAIFADSKDTVSTARELLTIKAGASHLFTLGGEVENSDLNILFEGKTWAPNEFEPQKDITSAEKKKLETIFKGTSTAAFMKDRWKVMDPLTLVFGARWVAEDYLEESYTLPRASLEIKPSEGLLITAGWGKYAQFPQVAYVVDVFGNPNLKFEKSDHYTIGVKKSLYGGAWDAQVEVYHKTFENLVVPHKETNYVNAGSGEARGFEVLLRKNASLESGLFGWLAVTYSKSNRENELTGETFQFSHDQPLVINAVASYRLTNWTISGRWHFNSGSPFTPVVGAYQDETGRHIPIYGEIGDERLPDSHQLDIRADRTIRYNNWKLSIFFEAQNLYARDNVTGYTYNDDYTEREPAAGVPPIAAFGVEASF